MNILIFQTLGTVYSDAAPGSELQPGSSAQSAAADAMPQTSQPPPAVSKNVAIQVKPLVSSGPIFCAVYQITWAKFWPMRKDMTYDHQAITWANIEYHQWGVDQRANAQEILQDKYHQYES